MTATVKELISLLVLERLEENLFRGPSRDIGTSRVYGGQVLGQALKAAQYTVDDRHIHSLHAYFLREGDHNAPIIYEVDRSRDGGSFSARRVVAIQHGRPIFTLAASFQIVENSMNFQTGMPVAPLPDELVSVKLHESMQLDQLPEKIQRLLRLSAPFDFRAVELTADKNHQNILPYSQFWIKTAGPLPDDTDLHNSILAYVSDYGLLTTTLVPHGLADFETKLQMASIDHAMWFHRPFRMDEWLLYSCEAISTSNSRGLARGGFYTLDGILVATTIQEGLVRIRKKGTN